MTSHTLTPGNTAQNPATHAPQGANDSSLSPELSACYRAVNESFAMLTIFKNPSAKAAAAMDEDTEILHIRLISGWNDDSLYQIEQQIEAIQGGAL